jgi:hypothetical protein
MGRMPCQSTGNPGLTGVTVGDVWAVDRCGDISGALLELPCHEYSELELGLLTLGCVPPG